MAQQLINLISIKSMHVAIASYKVAIATVQLASYVLDFPAKNTNFQLHVVKPDSVLQTVLAVPSI